MSVLMNPRKQNRATDIGKGLAGLAGATALVVGVPAALLRWVGSPLPAGLPSVSDVAGALRDTYIPDEFLVKALALVCWLVWIELVASLLVEAVAYARGRKAGSVPLAGGLQRGAARLVATVALLGVLVASRGGTSADRATQPLAAVAPQPAPMSLVVDQEDAGDVDGAGAPAVDDDPAAAAAPSYEVQRRDTLWDIAERHLGDPFRWQEIFRLNEGCPQADGGCLTDPDLIFAGWRLELPADAVGLVESAAEPSPAADAPAPGPHDDSSVVLDGGMVLINEDGGSPGGSGGFDSVGHGGAAGTGEVLVGSGAAATGGGMVLLPDEVLADLSAPVDPAGGGGGMVLLPDDALADTDGSAVLAGPPAAGSPHARPAPGGAAGAGDPGESASDDGDEMAAPPDAPDRPSPTGPAGAPPR